MIIAETQVKSAARLTVLKATKDGLKADMSVYRLFGKELETYNKISSAINAQSNYVNLPRTSPDEALLLYNKAISESYYGYLYQPGQISISNSVLGTTLHLKMCKESERIISFFSRVDFEVADIIAITRQSKNTYEKVLSVYKYYVDNFNYVHESVTSDIKFHTVAAPFIYREAVCEGFAFSFAHVMNRMGVPCGVVAGESFLNGMNGSHAWNVIRVDNGFYHLDVTWDICTKDKGKNLFDYFLLDDQLMSRDHRWSDYSVPVCSDSSKEFYAYHHMICHNEQEIIEVLKKQLLSGNTSIGFRYCGTDTDKVLNRETLARIVQKSLNQTNETYNRFSFSSNVNTGTISCVFG